MLNIILIYYYGYSINYYNKYYFKIISIKKTWTLESKPVSNPSPGIYLLGILSSDLTSLSPSFLV